MSRKLKRIFSKKNLNNKLLKVEKLLKDRDLSTSSKSHKKYVRKPKNLKEEQKDFKEEQKDFKEEQKDNTTNNFKQVTKKYTGKFKILYSRQIFHERNLNKIQNKIIEDFGNCFKSIKFDKEENNGRLIFEPLIKKAFDIKKEDNDKMKVNYLIDRIMNMMVVEEKLDYYMSYEQFISYGFGNNECHKKYFYSNHNLAMPRVLSPVNKMISKKQALILIMNKFLNG